MSHQLISVILFFVLGLEAISYLIRGHRRDFAFSFIMLGLAGALFLFKIYSPQLGTITVPLVNVSTTTSLGLALHMSGLLLYCYFLLIPFAAVGIWRLKNWTLRLWVLWCVAIPVVLMFSPELPLYYWNRWVYLLVYPLLFFTVEGLDRLWRFVESRKSNFRRLAPKAVAVIYIALLLVLSGFYLATPPENQMPFFSTANPYLTYVPSSMLQNMLPIADNAYLVNCVDWINNDAANNSIIVSHYALYDLINLYNNRLPIIPVQPPPMWVHTQNESALAQGMVAASRNALAAGNGTVYTIWWVNGEGWYGITSLPNNFREIYRTGEMAVYVFDSRIVV